MHWQTSRFCIDLAWPVVMGVVNVTPDSFSDGGHHLDPAQALRRCEQLIAEGAALLDIGAESTRPGASMPSPGLEWARLQPVLSAAVTFGVPVSVDTSTPMVMQRALELGADVINDVRAFVRPGAVQALAAHPAAGACLMHMRGEPGVMQADPVYADVVSEVCDFLRARQQALRDAGIADGRIVLDPGIGFGKTAGHNLQLLRRQRDLLALGRPLLVGWSRKSTLGILTGRPVGERRAASVAAALLAAQRGARVLRVHDVAATVDALRVWQAVAANDDDDPREGNER
ncbi:MAG: dihydropteroate synthase [Rubrivivax sp.]